MKSIAQSFAPARAPKISRLAVPAGGERLLLPLSLIAALAVGVWLGFDLHREVLAVALDRLFLLLLALAAPLPIAALGALYHEPLHRVLLPWPVSAARHFRLGLSLLLRRHGPWLAIALGAGLGAGWQRSPRLAVLLAVFSTLCWCGALLAAAGLAGLGAAAADAEGATAEKLRASLAGPFASPRHAPFFYLPALAFALAAIVALAALAGVLRLAAPQTGASALGWALLGAPLVVGLLALLLGAWAYARHGLRTIARVHEETRTVFGGRPAPVDPPYGGGLERWLPRRVAPYFGKELREQARAHRGLWALVTLFALVCAAYAVNVGSPLRAAPLIAALVLIWLACAPLRRTPRLSGPRYVITLPLHRKASFFGRWLALLWPLTHAGLAAMLALGLRHGLRAASLVAALALVAAAAASATTGPSLERRSDQHWGAGARLIPALAFAAAILGMTLLGGSAP